VLDEWVRSATANPQLLVPDEVLTILHDLKRFPASPTFLKDTMVAAAVSAVAKLPHAKAARYVLVDRSILDMFKFSL
jgi:hypothetical protein